MHPEFNDELRDASAPLIPGELASFPLNFFSGLSRIFRVQSTARSLIFWWYQVPLSC